MSKAQQVFAIDGVRNLILLHYRKLKWGRVTTARSLIINRTLRNKTMMRSPQDQIHLTNPFNWRETAVVLGLYWLLE